MRPQSKHSRTFKKSRRLGSSARARTSRVSSLKKPCVAVKQTSSSSPAGTAQLSLLQRLRSHARNSLQLNRLCQGITRLLPFKDILTRRWLLLARSHSQLRPGSGNANNNAERSRRMAAKRGCKPLRRGRNYFDRQQAVMSQIDKILTCREYVRQKRRTRAANLFSMKKRAHRSPFPNRNNRNTPYRMGPSFNESWVCSPSSSRYKMAITSRNSSPADSRCSCRSVRSRPASYASVRSRDMSYSNSSRCQMANKSQQFTCRFAKKSSTLGASRCCHLEDRSPYQSPFQPNHYNANNRQSNHYNANNRQSNHYNPNNRQSNHYNPNNRHSNHYNANNRQNNHKKRARSHHSSSSSDDSESERRYKSAKYRVKQPGVLPSQRALRRLFMCLVM